MFESNHAFKGPTWLKPVHCIVKLSLKLAVKGQGETTNQCTPGIVCIHLFSVFMGHKESLGMRLCPRPIFIFDVSLGPTLPRACTTWLYHTISTPAFRAPPLLLLMTTVNAHKNNLG